MVISRLHLLKEFYLVWSKFVDRESRRDRVLKIYQDLEKADGCWILEVRILIRKVVGFAYSHFNYNFDQYFTQNMLLILCTKELTKLFTFLIGIHTEIFQEFDCHLFFPTIRNLDDIPAAEKSLFSVDISWWPQEF